MKKFLITIVFSTISILLISQNNADSLFAEAINHTKNLEYSEALIKAKTVFEQNPDRADVAVFIANVYAWQQDYDSALYYIDKAYQLNPYSEELYFAWLNILLWSEQHAELLKVADLAVNNGYNDNRNIVLKKTLALKALGRYNDAIYVLENEIDFLEDNELRYLFMELNDLNHNKFISAFYSIDITDNEDFPFHHMAFVDYGIKHKQSTYIIRANFANRFASTDFQIEADYYRNFSNRNYIYANYGFGLNNTLFPKHRVGLEYFIPFNPGFEVSLGTRVLLFENVDAYIITGHFGKYFGNSWASVRPYYSFSKSNSSLAAIFNYRIYSKNNAFWGLEVAYGNSPDERASIDVYESLWLQTYRIKLEKNFRVAIKNEVRISAGYAYEEMPINNYRNRLLIEVLFKHRF
jgi:YaiO family outer membrane protein